MQKLLFRLAMAAFGLLIFIWLLNQVSPFLQSLKHIGDTLGK